MAVSLTRHRMLAAARRLYLYFPQGNKDSIAAWAVIPTGLQRRQPAEALLPAASLADRTVGSNSYAVIRQIGG